MAREIVSFLREDTQVANVVLIAGSPSHPSRTSAVLEYSKTILASEGFNVELIGVSHAESVKAPIKSGEFEGC